MSTILEKACATLWTGSDLDEAALLAALARAGSRGVDWADLYFQHIESHDWLLEEGIVKTGHFSIDRGYGLRTVVGERQALSYGDDLAARHLLASADDLRSLTGSRSVTMPARLSPQTVRPLYSPDVEATEPSREIELLRHIDRYARSLSPAVRNLTATLQAEVETVLVADLEGRLTADIRPQIYLSVTRAGGGLVRKGRPRSGPADRSAPRALGRDARRARPGLARDSSSRSRGTRPRSRRPPQGNLRLHGPDRRARRAPGRHDRRRRKSSGAARVAHGRRRRNAHAAHHPHRGRHSHGTSHRPLQRPRARTAAHRKRPARELRDAAASAHDEHLHALGRTHARRDRRHHERRLRLHDERSAAHPKGAPCRTRARRDPHRPRRPGATRDPARRKRLETRRRHRAVRQFASIPSPWAAPKRDAYNQTNFSYPRVPTCSNPSS